MNRGGRSMRPATRSNIDCSCYTAVSEELVSLASWPMSEWPSITFIIPYNYKVYYTVDYHSIGYTIAVNAFCAKTKIRDGSCILSAAIWRNKR